MQPAVYGEVDIIMQTCPCNEHPLTPHFYIVNLGCTGVYIIFSFIFALKHRLFLRKNVKIDKKFQLQIVIFEKSLYVSWACFRNAMMKLI